MQAQTKFWFARELGGVEMLRSTYLDPAHSKHMHATFTVGVVDAGVIVNQNRGETSFIPKNSVYVFNPGEVHSGYAHEQVISYRTLYPSEAALGELARDIGLRGTPYFENATFHTPDSAARVRALHRLLEQSESHLERETAVLHILGKLLKRHTSLPFAERPAGKEPAAVKEVRDYLEVHFRENVSLEALALLVGLSRSYLIRVFKRSVGIPPYTYLIQRRIEHAKHLLRSGEPAAQVALEVGFSDQSHLNLHFKRVMNLTPARYARSHYLPRKVCR